MISLWLYGRQWYIQLWKSFEIWLLRYYCSPSPFHSNFAFEPFCILFLNFQSPQTKKLRGRRRITKSYDAEGGLSAFIADSMTCFNGIVRKLQQVHGLKLTAAEFVRMGNGGLWGETFFFDISFSFILSSFSLPSFPPSPSLSLSVCVWWVNKLRDQ